MHRPVRQSLRRQTTTITLRRQRSRPALLGAIRHQKENMKRDEAVFCTTDLATELLSMPLQVLACALLNHSAWALGPTSCAYVQESPLEENGQ
jgi:hypothetical protein